MSACSSVFVYGLFEDIYNSLRSAALNGRCLRSGKLERIWKERLWPNRGTILAFTLRD
jgi:hypothetical protein